MSPAKRTGKSPGKAPSTTPPVSPSSMSPTDLRVLAQALSDQVQTLTAELQTAQDAQDQAASLHITQLQTLRAQVHDQAMEIQGWEHRAASRSQDLRLLLADQAVEIRDLTGRLDRASRQRDVMRDDNDHLLREMALAGSEIHQLQSRIHDLERDLEDSQTAGAAADASLDRLRDGLRLTQEEVVTSDYVGSTHVGSALGSARGGSPAPNPPPSSPDVALAQLSEELQDAKESLEKASAGRDYALEEFVRITQLRDKIQAKLADSELQRDKAATEWADAKCAQTELESKLRCTSDKLKEADATATKLRDQLAAAQTQQRQLVLERDRSLSERARRRLALVTAAVSDPLPPLSGPSRAASASAPLPSVSGADPSHARASSKAKSKTSSASKAASQVGPTSAPEAGSKFASKTGPTSTSKTSASPSKSGAGSKTGSITASKSTSVSTAGSGPKTGSTASKTGSGPKTGCVVVSKAGSSAFKSGSTAKAGSVAVSKSGSAPKTGSTTAPSSQAVVSPGSTAIVAPTTGSAPSTAKSGQSQSGSTAAPSVTTPTVLRPASTGHPPARAGSGKGKAKRVIPPGCGLGRSEDDEDEESDWSDGSGPPNRSSSKRTSSSGPYPFTLSDEDDRRSWRSTTMRCPPPPDPGDPLPGDPPPPDPRSPPPRGDPLPPSLPDSPSLSTWIADPAVSPPVPAGSPPGFGSGLGQSPSRVFHQGILSGSSLLRILWTLIVIVVVSGGSPGSPHGGGSPGSSHGGGSPGSVLIPALPNSSLPGMLPVAPFGPDAAFIPGRRAPVAFATRDIEPWSAKKLNRITVLFPELPFRAEWIFPRTADAIPRAGYVDSLITRPLVEELTSVAPWDTQATTPVDPVSFRGDVRGRLGVFVRALRDFVSKHRVAIWEGIHRFPISRNQLQGSTWLSNFNKQRGNRRSHAGRAWKRVLAGWCDVDSLLDPSFLHLPRRGDKVAWFPGSVSRQANLEDPNLLRPEPTSLLEALREIDEAEPWRIQFRGDLSQHPGRQIQRLVGKFFNVQPKTT
ncbi:hypothetical protein PInf_023305 [Phytophthora infestans]|nr:hypothetical protein PInf_023305 [Phytophthora infestans]